MQGIGVYFFKSGDKYQGSWTDGRRHGRGRMEYSNGDVYDGEWEADQRAGAGVLIAGITLCAASHCVQQHCMCEAVLRALQRLVTNTKACGRVTRSTAPGGTST